MFFFARINLLFFVVSSINKRMVLKLLFDFNKEILKEGIVKTCHIHMISLLCMSSWTKRFALIGIFIEIRLQVIMRLAKKK
jgi:hypothetical protein